MVEEQWIDFFAKHHLEGRVNHYTYSKKVVHYASIGSDNLPALLFLTDKSSVDLYSNFYKDEILLKEFSIYAAVIATPAFRAAKTISIQQQSEIIYPLAERIHRVHQPFFIITSEYVAAAACELVARHPGIVQGLILIDPVLRAEPENKNWFTTFLKKILAGNKKKRKRGDKSKILFRKQLGQMDDVWKKIQIPVVYLQSVANKSSPLMDVQL